jgi:alpha-glucosidase
VKRLFITVLNNANIELEERLHVKIYDADLNVFQVQEDVVPRPPHEQTASSDAALEFQLVEKPFSFKVKRKENEEVLFDTSSAKLVFETQYVRLRTSLPNNPYLYGLGEHSDPFRLPLDYKRSMLNAESPFIPKNSNLYGSHPVYFEHRGKKGTHGVFLLNSTPMDIVINKTASGDQFLEYNTIGGVIDLYFMPGMTPVDVSRQYADVVGYSAMYPYWTFGYHQCKYGYWDVNMVAEVVGNYSTAGIPLEVMWTDIDYMELRKDFTVDKERFPVAKMRELVSTLHQRDQRYVLILDPGVNLTYDTYTRGHEMGVFLKNKDGSDNLGIQWPGTVAWPDWFAPNTSKWWTNEVHRFFDAETGIDIDGIWVDMNEASNFCLNYDCDPTKPGDDTPPKPKNSPRPNTGRPIPGFPAGFQPSKQTRAVDGPQSGQMKGIPNRQWFDPPYTVRNHKGGLSDNTILFNTTNYDGTMQYDTHNLYGHMMALTTHESMLTRRPELRPMVLTRSTFAGSGRKVTHWFGDNKSIWEDYRTSIRQMLAWVAMHQMPMVGSDVCGFNGDTDEKLCARWALLGAFQPFYRNHAELSSIPQEFYQWPLVAEAGKKAIEARYKLMDYAYTALFYQTVDGTPLINPLFYLYPNDENTFDIENQWFYGDALLISPVVQDYSDQVTFYLPNDTFYDFWTHKRVEGQGKNVTRTDVKYTDIPVHIRGGTIIPYRINSANTTKELRKQDFAVLIAPDAEGKAEGRLYIDEGERIVQPDTSEMTFKFENGAMTIYGIFNYEPKNGESTKLVKAIVLGQDTPGASQAGVFNEDSGTVEIEGEWDLGKGVQIKI